MTALERIRDGGYRAGNLQAILYDRTRTDLFPEGYIGSLYALLKDCGRGPNGVLDVTFGGNPPSTFDAVVPFLAARPLVILGLWEDGLFKEAGVAFPVLFCGTQQTQAAAFCGFAFLPWIWGTEDINTVAVLGLSLLFVELKLIAIHGTRFESNTLAGRFMQRFGFQDIGTLPHYHLKDGKLVPTVISTLSRADFEKIAEKVVVEGDGDGEEEDIAQGEPESASETAVAVANHEGPETQSEQNIARLIAGTVNAVWIPAGSRYMPQVPEGCATTIVDGLFPGDGVYVYNPHELDEFDIWTTVANGRHEELLQPVNRNPVPEPEPLRTLTLVVTRKTGEVVTEVEVPATAEAIEHAVADFPHFDVHVKKDGEEKPGAKGGRARAAKMSKEERSENARRAARARWEK